MSGIETGKKAPAFSMETDNGDTVTLGSYNGRKLVLYFYPKDDTPGCTKEAIGFTENMADFKKNGAEILGVSKDTTAKHNKFKQKHHLGIALASDPDGTVLNAYGSWIEKNMYGRKYMGIDRSTFLIDEKGIIRGIWRKVRVPGHVEQVLAMTKEI